MYGGFIDVYQFQFHGSLAPAAEVLRNEQDHDRHVVARLQGHLVRPRDARRGRAQDYGLHQVREVKARLRPRHKTLSLRFGCR